ncbi:MAG: MBOAT family protein [Nitrospinota bacterium]|nr:MBOAT family protein [Nitrospinota bacterium]
MSLLFYSFWRVEFCLLIIFSAGVDFIASRKIYGSEDERKRKIYLAISLVTNLGLLAIFKYTYFVYDNISFIATQANYRFPSFDSIAIKIILPLGISFYTFQTISYTIDVFRKIVKPIDNFNLFLAYVIFWPQLIAGPILRFGEVVPQLVEEKKFMPELASSGIVLIIVGLFKKVVLADNLAIFVDAGFEASVSQLNALDIWLLSFMFGFQIYFDFSAYSDIAIGSARLLGIYFPDNFNWPYMAVSPKEFWNRWHISLSSWVRDYLYLPIIGEKFRTDSKGGIGEAAVSKKRDRNKALFVTWMLMGLWHGANWTFVLWGIYHAVFIFIYRVIKIFNFLERKLPVISWLFTIFVVMAGWILFRSENISESAAMYSILLNPNNYSLNGRIFPLQDYFMVFVLISTMVIMYEIWKKNINRYFDSIGWVFTRYAAIAVMIFFIAVYLKPVQQFIYFQF